MFIKHALYRNTVIPTVEKGLDAGALRSKTIANNLANVTTPDYKRIEVKFEETLKEAIDKNRVKGVRTDLGHLPIGKKELEEIMPVGYRSLDITRPGEVNNVDIDIEASKLAENKINYNYAINFMKGQTVSLISAIKGRA